jgi:hypothetical protein
LKADGERQPLRMEKFRSSSIVMLEDFLKVG